VEPRSRRERERGDLAPQWKSIWSRPGEKTEARWKKEVKDGPVEVESEVEVLAPDPVPLGAAAGAALAAGALMGAFVSPELDCSPRAAAW